jgi:hypothetical protein
MVEMQIENGTRGQRVLPSWLDVIFKTARSQCLAIREEACCASHPAIEPGLQSPMD